MKTLEEIKTDSLLKNRVRSFLGKNDFLEVDTPIMSRTAIPEATIELFNTTLLDFDLKKKDILFLLPSPEKYLKRYLSTYKKSVYNFSHCFRNSEQSGPWHKNEFTMLEWYKINADEKTSIEFTKELFIFLLSDLNNSDKLLNFNTISLKDEFYKATSVKIEDVQDDKSIKKVALNMGVINNSTLTEPWNDTFNRIFLNFIEPNLKKINGVIFLTDYPKKINVLANDSNDNISKKRWEIYIDGVEIANCYSEMEDKNKIKKFFNEETKLKLKNDPCFKSDEELIDFDIPKSSGVSIGWDRLLSKAMGMDKIND